MSVNIRSLFFVTLFLCLANVLFGQEKDSSDFKHRIAWTKDNYALRYEMLAEDNDADLTKQEKQKDLFTALFVEGLGYTRNNIALGGGITFGGSLDGKGIGLSLLYAMDSENFIFLETLAQIRLYLSSNKDNTGFFLQAEGGIVFFSYEKFEFTGYFAPVGGICAGWRYMMNKQWYIEPFIRGGYPYIFGVGFSTGFRFDL